MVPGSTVRYGIELEDRNAVARDFSNPSQARRHGCLRCSDTTPAGHETNLVDETPRAIANFNDPPTKAPSIKGSLPLPCCPTSPRGHPMGLA